MFDFRGANLTAAATVTLAVCTFVHDTMTSVSGTAGSVSGTGSGSGSGGAINTLFRFLNSRFLALPMAWTTLFSVYVLTTFGSRLERRFGTARYATIVAFLGGTAAVLSQSLLAILVPAGQHQQHSGRAVLLTPPTVSSPSAPSFWNPLIVALAALAAFRIPRRSAPAPAAASPRGNNRGPPPADLAATLLGPSLARFVPIGVSAAAVLANILTASSMMMAASSSSSPSRRGSAASVLAASTLVPALLSMLCAAASGIAAAAAVQYYPPLLEMLNSISDSAAVRGAANAALAADSVYVRQQGPQQTPEQRRQVEDAEDAQLRQALQASMGGGGGGARGARGGAGGGGFPNQQQQQQQHRPPAAAAMNQQQQQPTPQEVEALQFLSAVAPHADRATLLGTLRACRGDANAAAAMLLDH